MQLQAKVFRLEKYEYVQIWNGRVSNSYFEYLLTPFLSRMLLAWKMGQKPCRKAINIARIQFKRLKLFCEYCRSVVARVCPRIKATSWSWLYFFKTSKNNLKGKQVALKWIKRFEVFLSNWRKCPAGVSDLQDNEIIPSFSIIPRPHNLSLSVASTKLLSSRGVSALK